MKASVRDFTQTQKTTKRGAKNIAELIEYLSTLHKDLVQLAWGVGDELHYPRTDNIPFVCVVIYSEVTFVSRKRAQ